MKACYSRLFLAVSLVLAAAVLLNGCAATSFRTSPNLTHRASQTKLLLMPMDVQLSTLTAGGILKPEADWTAKATAHMETAILVRMGSINVNLIPPGDIAKVEVTAEEADKRIQLVKLHEAVGTSILVHQYSPPNNLPAKRDQFAWTLGPQARFLKEKYGADYALFVFMRDSYASAGRAAFFIIAAAFGVGIPMGMQTGFASLVDLDTGEIVWFNRVASGAGDLRTLEYASASMASLLKDFPQ